MMFVVTIRNLPWDVWNVCFWIMSSCIDLWCCQDEEFLEVLKSILNYKECHQVQKSVCKMLLMLWGIDPIWPIIYMIWNHHDADIMYIKLGCQCNYIFRYFYGWASWKFLSLSNVTGKGIIPTCVGDTPGHEEKNWKCLRIRRTAQWIFTDMETEKHSGKKLWCCFVHLETGTFHSSYNNFNSYI